MTDDPRSAPWQIDESDFPADAPVREKLEYLLRYAILAPSTHNTQPWQFSIEDHEIGVYADKTRWLRVADAAQRELHVSVGCAIENLLTAARYFGYKHRLNYPAEVSDEDVIALVASIELEPDGKCTEEVRSRFKAITSRWTDRGSFKSKPIPEEIVDSLKSCVSGEGLSLFLIGDEALKTQFQRLVVEADKVQFADPAFRQELTHWIGRGGYGLSWLTSKIAKLAVKYGNVGESTARVDTDVLKSTPVVGFICSQADDRQTFVRVGQALERLYLTTTDLGLSLQPLGQLCEVPFVRARIKEMIFEQEWYPQQPFRLGYAEGKTRHTPRRPLEEVLY